MLEFIISVQYVYSFHEQSKTVVDTNLKMLTLEPEKTNSWEFYFFLIILQTEGYYETFKGSESKRATTLVILTIKESGWSTQYS